MSGDPVAALIVSARQFLQLRKDAGTAVDRGAIEKVVQLVAPTAGAAIGHSYSADEVASAIRLLETIFVVVQGPSISLTDRARPPEWYVGERRKPGPFMDRYLQKLEEGNWAVELVRHLRESTARVLEVLDDPARPGPWDWRGLVVGDVQSGKTAHDAGVVNRAADAGYRVIVVLAGMHNVLRLQTQKRLDQDFLGYDTDPKSFSDTGRRIPLRCRPDQPPPYRRQSYCLFHRGRFQPESREAGQLRSAQPAMSSCREETGQSSAESELVDQAASR